MILKEYMKDSVCGVQMRNPVKATNRVSAQDSQLEGPRELGTSVCNEGKYRKEQNQQVKGVGVTESNGTKQVLSHYKEKL